MLKENILILLCILSFFYHLLFGSELPSNLRYSLLAIFSIFFILKVFLSYSLSIRYVSVPAFFLSVYTIVYFIPGLSAYYILNTNIGFWYLISVATTYITVPLGVVLYNFISRNASLKVMRYSKSNVQSSSADHSLFVLFLIFVTIIFLSTVLFILNAEFIQLIEVIKSYPTPYGKLEFRFGSEKVPKLVLGIFEISRRLLLPLCVMYIYIKSKVKKGVWRILLFVFFPVALFISLLTLDRAPPVGIFGAMAIVVFLLPSKRFIVKLTKGVIFVALGAITGGVVSIAQYQAEFSLERIEKTSNYVLFYRIAQDAAYSAAKTFKVYDSPDKYLHGKQIRMFSFLPGRKFRNSLENIDYRAQRINGPASFVGDLWRNWGFVGVILGSIFIGFYYQFIQVNILSKKNISGMTIKILVLVSSIWIIWGNMFGIVTSGVLIIALILGKMAQFRYRLR